MIHLPKPLSNPKEDWPFPLLLLGLACFIWLRNTSWIADSDDTLPILVCLPAYFWIADPISFKSNPGKPSSKLIGYGVGLFLVGVILNLTLILAIAWTTLFWSWVSAKTETHMHTYLKKLLILPIMAFPWVFLDAQQIGWWFRYTGTITAESFFSFAGFHVVRDGTFLTVNHMQVSVEQACSGLNTLQSMLIAGSMANFLLLGETNRYYMNLLWIPVLAWVANTVRILAITIAGLAVSEEFAKGPFHDYGGWLILVFMFGLCWQIFSVQATSLEEQTKK